MTTVSTCGTVGKELSARRIPTLLRGKSADFATDSAKDKIQDEIPSGQKPLTFKAKQLEDDRTMSEPQRSEGKHVSRARQDAGQVSSCGKASCGDERLERGGA